MLIESKVVFVLINATYSITKNESIENVNLVSANQNLQVTMKIQTQDQTLKS